MHQHQLSDLKNKAVSTDELVWHIKHGLSLQCFLFLGFWQKAFGWE